MARADEHQANTGPIPVSTAQESKLPQTPEALAPSKVAELRRHFAEIALMLAETEDKVAQHHEDLAAPGPIGPPKAGTSQIRHDKRPGEHEWSPAISATKPRQHDDTRSGGSQGPGSFVLLESGVGELGL